MIYLDNAATTKPKKEVIEAMMPYLTDMWYNPSSLYTPSVNVKKDIEKARETIAKFIEADSNEIFFTSCGSESNCFAIQGFVNKCLSRNRRPIVITSMIEHKSILECVKNLYNTDVFYINVDSEGYINLKLLEDILQGVSDTIKSQKSDVLVSIQFSNNEIGTTQHIEHIAKLVHKYGGVFHTDAVQAFGQVKIDVKNLDIDMMSVSGHKIGTPKGIGFLYKKLDVNIKPLIYGTQMDSMRGGTENVPYIIGMAKAIELLDIDKKMKVINIREYMVKNLIDKFECKLNGATYNRLLNNINVVLPDGVSGEAVLYMLEMSNIYISTSSACNSHSIKPSVVLKSIGLSDDEAMRSIRITISEDITYEDVDCFISELDKIIKIIKV